MIPPRTLLWGSILAVLGVVLFLGAASTSTPNVAAQPGDNRICRIEGPSTVQLGQSALYAFRVQDNMRDVFDLVGLQDTYGADINTRDGQAYISRVTGEQQYQEAILPSDFHPIWSMHVQSIDVENPNNFVPTPWTDAQAIDPRALTLLEQLERVYGYQLEGNPCGISVWEASEACIDEGFCEVWRTSTSSQRRAWANAIENATANGVVSCYTLMGIGEAAFLAAGGNADQLNGLDLSAEPGLEGGINGYWLAVCSFTTPSIVGPILDDVGFIEVTCTRVGKYTLSIFSQSPPDLPPFEDLSTSAASIDITCRGPVASANMFAAPAPIENVPSQGSVAHSLITVELKDAAGEPVEGAHVLFLTDRCAIESSTVDTADKFAEVQALFQAYTRLSPITALNIEQSDAALVAPDSSPLQEEVLSVNGIAATVLHCDPVHAPDAGPGPVTVKAIIEGPTQDYILTLVIPVVGPPAPNGLSAIGSPATMVCGEKAQIEATVLDAIGQFVSDHTLVEITTNAGGVLAGTGAVAGQQGNVAPISSTIAETFGGKASFFLLTSTQHVGKYEVVITTGGGAGVTGSNQSGTGGLLGGLWSTPPVSVQLTFECVMPQDGAAAAPTTTGPQAGHGSIRPPSTGDAGLEHDFRRDALPWIVGGIGALLISAYLSARFARD